MKSQQWEGKINRARYVERNILKWIQKYFDPEAKLVEKYDPAKDIISKVMGDIEVKEDRLAHQTDNYAIEFEDGNGKVSGIDATLSKHWVIVDWENVNLMATESLKYIIEQSKPLRTIEMGFKFDDGERSKGYLLPRHKVLLSPFVKTVPRWFPVISEANVRK